MLLILTTLSYRRKRVIPPCISLCLISALTSIVVKDTKVKFMICFWEVLVQNIFMLISPDSTNLELINKKQTYSVLCWVNWLDWAFIILYSLCYDLQHEPVTYSNKINITLLKVTRMMCCQHHHFTTQWKCTMRFVQVKILILLNTEHWWGSTNDQGLGEFHDVRNHWENKLLQRLHTKWTA